MRNTPAHVFLGMPQDNLKTHQLEQLRLSDFDKYRRFAQKWLQRREKRQQQPQQQPHKTLRQLLEPPSAHNAPPGQHVNGQSLQSQSLQGEQRQQQNWGLLHQKLQHGANLGLTPNQPYPPQHHPHSPYGAQPYNGVPAQVRYYRFSRRMILHKRCR